MASVLFLVPGMDGPRGARYNTLWPPEVEKMVQQNRWRVFTPSVLLLASIAVEEGYEVDVVDEEYRRADLSRRYDIVCMYTVTPNVKRAYRYAERFRANGAWIALGGVHASLLHSESAHYADTVLIGEGEHIFRTFLKDFSVGSAKKAYRQQTGEIELNEAPIPLFSALQGEAGRLVPLQTARGCPRNCRFCNVRSLYGSGLRTKTADRIAQEIAAIGLLPQTKSIYVTDDNICSDSSHLHRLFSVFSGSGLTWHANADISFAEDTALIRQAYKSGLRQVLIGLEGITEKHLAGIDGQDFKRRYLPRYGQYIERIQSEGIGVTGSFIVGREDDTGQTFALLADFIYQTRLYAASVTMYTPYPGTALYRQMDMVGKILSYDWNDYTIFQPVLKTQALSTKQINRLYLDLLRQIHSQAFMRNKLSFFQTIARERKSQA